MVQLFQLAASVHCVTMATADTTVREMIQELMYLSALNDSLLSSREQIDQCRGTVFKQYQLRCLVTPPRIINTDESSLKNFLSCINCVTLLSISCILKLR